MELQELRNAALEIYIELEKAGVEPHVANNGKGLAHVMWLAVQIGKKIDDKDKANRYLGNIQSALVYLNFWSQAEMMDRAFNWSRGHYKNFARPTRPPVRRPMTGV